MSSGKMDIEEKEEWKWGNAMRTTEYAKITKVTDAKKCFQKQERKGN